MKRIVDLVVSITALIVLLPVFALVCVLVRLKLGSPIFFSQQRPGRNTKPFNMVKFRTMTDARDSDGHLLPDNVRLTRFGQWLRSTSLDELPELWNVVKGDMSLVGPRPLLMHYVPLYSKAQFRRHEVRPGITGWAQVNGRNTLSWRRKFELDIWYVDNQSLWLDLKILVLTVKRVFQRDGISQEGCVTAEPFTGNDQVEVNDK